jgi:hypothetical protein
MRLFLAPVFALLATSAVTAGPRSDGPPANPAKAECRKTTAHPAWRGKPVKPRKLSELPPADGYLAVYRTVDGCEVPMTLVRQPQKR